MKTTSILRLAAASVALSISAHAAEVFSVTSITDEYPTVKNSAIFNAVDEVGNFTYGTLPPLWIAQVGTAQVGTAQVGVVGDADYAPASGDYAPASGDYAPAYGRSSGLTGLTLNTYSTTDSGVGAGWGGGIVTNFDGTKAISPGDHRTTTNGTGAITNETTYVGPKVYVGLNRDVQQLTAGVIHAYGNGYRIRCNNIGAGLIDSEGVGPSAQAVFMFDANGATDGADNLIFSGADTLTAKLALSADMGPNNAGKATAASYRAMVKANGEYYAGTIYNVDLAAELTPTNTTELAMSETGATATWTLMPNMAVAAGNNGIGGQNLTVDTSESATTVPGKFLTNITQVGFLIAATAAENAGGFNYGVREFIAQATPASAPDPIEWSQDFTSPVTILDSLSGLTGYDHAYTWSRAGGALTGAPQVGTAQVGTAQVGTAQVGEVGDEDYAAASPDYAPASPDYAPASNNYLAETFPNNGSVTQDETNDSVVIAITGNGANGEAYLRMVGNREQADSTRRVKPVSHETTWEIDLLAFKQGDADIMLTTNGFDGYVKSTIGASSEIKFTTWMADFTHTNFDNFSGPSKLRNHANNPGIVIVSGGTFDSESADPVTITISGNAEGTVNMNTAGDAVESVTLTNYGSGYTAQPTVTFAGGGMTVAPEISFNYNTGNIGGNIVKTVDLGLEILPQENGNKFWGVMNDGQIFTYTQSYNSADDSISYYFSLTNKATGVVNGPHFITTLTAADHSAGGLGFFDVTTGKRYSSPGTANNQKAIEVHLKRYSNADYESATTIGINSISVATTDDDRDGVLNRNDAFPTDPFESVDSDSDGTGDNSDQYDGLNDSVINAGITQEVYDAVVAGKTAAETAQATAEAAQVTAEAAQATAIADLAALPTLSDIQDLRAGSTMIAVADGSATVSLQLEESSDLSSWADLGAAVPFTVTLDPSDDTQFFRVKLAD